MKRKNFGIRVEDRNGRDIIKWFMDNNYLMQGQFDGSGYDGSCYYVDDNSTVDFLTSIPKNMKVYSLSELMQEQYKKIVGYKLKEKYDKDAFCDLIEMKLFDFKDFEKNGIENEGYIISILIKMDVLNLWFEPVYEKESLVESVFPNIDKSPYTIPSCNVVGEKKKDYKVGDWVVPTVGQWERFNLHNRVKGVAYLVKEINANRVILFTSDNETYEGQGIIDFHHIRPALKWEIEKAKNRGKELTKHKNSTLELKNFISEIQGAITKLYEITNKYKNPNE